MPACSQTASHRTSAAAASKCAGRVAGSTVRQVVMTGESSRHRLALPMPKNHDGILKQLRAFGMTYPGAHYKSPWPGHMDLAVNDKTFAYLSLPGEPLHIGCK